MFGAAHPAADGAVDRNDPARGEKVVDLDRGLPTTVEKSMNRLMREPSATAVATSRDACGDGRLAITVSALSATSRADDAARAPKATSSLITSARVSNATTLWPASTSRSGDGKTHVAQADKPDVHVG